MDGTDQTHCQRWSGGRFFFGRSVAINETGDVIVVGAMGRDDGNARVGTAYVFEKVDGTWEERTKLANPVGMANDNAGFSVAISGKTAAIGTFRGFGFGIVPGFVYIYKFSEVNSQWLLQDILIASDSFNDDQFGWSVDIKGNTLLVGRNTRAGAAYVFENDGTSNWNEVIKLEASDKNVGDQFGHSVSLEENDLVVGAISDADICVLCGSAYVFKKINGLWTEHIKLTASDQLEEPGFGTFGRAVSIFKSVAAVGGGAFGTINSGKAYAYQIFKIRNDVVVNLPSGVTILLNNNTSSVVLHADTATAIATADVDNNGVDDIIASFALGSGPGGTGGTFISKNGGLLLSISDFTAEIITAGNYDGVAGEDLFIDFGADGLGLYPNGGSVAIVTPFSPIAMASGDVNNNGKDEIIFSFNEFGTIVIKNLSLPAVVLDGSAAATLAVGDMDNNGEDDIIASFAPGTGPGGTGGLFFSMNQGPLTFIADVRAEQVVFGNFDRLDGDDVLFDLGADGLWLLKNNINASLLTTFTPVAMASGDMDSSGQDDMILSFDAFGTIAFKNFSLPIEVLDASVALDIATGNVDGK